MTIRLSLLGLCALTGCITPQDHGRLLDGGSPPDDGSLPGDASTPADGGTVADGGGTEDAASGADAGPRVDPARVHLNFLRSRREPYRPFDEPASYVSVQLWVFEAVAVDRLLPDAPLATSGPCVSRSWPGVGHLGPPRATDSPARFIDLDPSALRVFHDGAPQDEVTSIDGSLYWRTAAHGDADTIRVELTIPGHPTVVREHVVVDPPRYPMPEGEEGIRDYARGVPLEVRHGPATLPGGVFWAAITNDEVMAICDGDGWDGNVVLPWAFVSTLLSGDERRGGIGHQSVLFRTYTEEESIEDGIPMTEMVQLMRFTDLELE